MRYLYKSEDGEELIEEMPMDMEHPDSIEKDGKVFKRVFCVSVHVPEWFTKNELKFSTGKSPSGNKHIF